MFLRSSRHNRQLKVTFSNAGEAERWQPQLLTKLLTETNQAMKILIAEDEPMVLKTLCLYLGRAGFNVVTAADGKSAMDIFELEKPDMVVTDLLMPSASGNELISFIRNTMESKVPIVVVSTVGLENSVISALKLGADDYIVKPLRLNEVVARVNRFVRA